MLDNTAATWTSREVYQMRDTAQRYEKYEKNFAAMVSAVVRTVTCIKQGVLAHQHRTPMPSATL